VIEPWQVWRADLDPAESHEHGGVRPVVIVSSGFHLDTQQARNAIVCPLTSTDRGIRTQVAVSDPRGVTSFVMTEQPRFISTFRFEHSEPLWTLTEAEVASVQRALKLMVDF
jgi:mRNA-degrading endonuclease toxin of MazEF toxin-antitoxin module